MENTVPGPWARLIQEKLMFKDVPPTLPRGPQPTSLVGWGARGVHKGSGPFVQEGYSQASFLQLRTSRSSHNDDLVHEPTSFMFLVCLYPPPCTAGRRVHLKIPKKGWKPWGAWDPQNTWNPWGSKMEPVGSKTLAVKRGPRNCPKEGKPGMAIKCGPKMDPLGWP